MIDALPRDEVGAPSPFDDAHLSWLTDSISRNRFLPQPDANSIFVGDGDFRAIGAEFLGHFVRTGGLRPHHRVLDIGCGIGRMAVPLTQYLDGDSGRYEGLDPVEGGIRWCRSTVTPAYPNFAFQRLDIAHELYNPSGKIRGRELKLPFADGQFDFIIMTSVVTHLPAEEVMAYLAEIFRVLALGGRLFMTAFIVDDAARQNATGRRDPRLAFARAGQGPCWFVPDQPPLAAVGFDDGFLEDALGRTGLSVVLKSLGHWRAPGGTHYQDILVGERRRSHT
ncbi:Ubiquinone/menaquinone biosynthesis C-methyltransferase UbiE [Ensifer adhaerens]|uniref:class I SAM-dependent methyltransferase n=1 Tax=Ensifer adhaerens TaxID=106592 RepID=UPI001568DE18|nr:class I SAM-dependent methyltransferase [Ensifer adhaerens]NRP21231.1 Ubiquinone/menaquinone biosynthesis C-methyltransferase UbiE [Ensifer adhaerens]